MRERTGVKPVSRTKMLERIEGSYGGGTVSQPTRATWRYDVIPTGSAELDWALGCGGWIRGRVAEIWGNEQIGKSLMCLLAAANAQRVDRERHVLWFDIENSFDVSWAESFGIDMKRFDLVQPQSAEEVSDLVKQLVGTGEYSLCVLDSIGAMISQVEREKDAAEATVAKVAGIVTRMLHNSLSLLRDTNTAMVIINQVRANLSGYGSETKAAGGYALKHDTTHRVHVKKDSTEKPFLADGDKGEKVGQQLAMKVEKNRVAPADRVATVRLFSITSERHGPAGVDRAMEAWTLGTRLGIVVQRGSIYDLPHDDHKGIKGKESVLDRLRQNPSLVSQVRSRALALSKDKVAKSLAEEG